MGGGGVLRHVRAPICMCILHDAAFAGPPPAIPLTLHAQLLICLLDLPICLFQQPATSLRVVSRGGWVQQPGGNAVGLQTNAAWPLLRALAPFGCAPASRPLPPPPSSHHPPPADTRVLSLADDTLHRVRCGHARGSG